MSLFSNTLPSVISRTGEWLDGVFGSPIKSTETRPDVGGINLIKSQFPASTAVSTPQTLPQNKTDIVGKILGFAKSQFQKSQEAQEDFYSAQRNMQARAFGITDPEKIAKLSVVDIPLLGGLQKKVAGEVIKKAPQTIKALGEETLQQGKGVVESIKNIFKPSKIAQIPPKIAPETITLYRAAPKFPSDKFSKGTYFADTEQSARFYSESHYRGDPSDIKVEQFTLLKNAVFKEPSTGNYILKSEAPVSRAISKELEPLAQEARKYKSAEEFVENIRNTNLENRAVTDIPINQIDFEFDIAKRDFAKAQKEIVEGTARTISDEPLRAQFNITTGKYEVVDGYHRLADAINKGKTNIKAGIEYSSNVSGNQLKSQLTDFYNKAVGKVGEIVKKVPIQPQKVERGFVTSVKEAYPEIKVAGQYIPRSTDRLAIKAKNLIQDDIMAAEAIARTGTDDDAVAVASELIKHYGDEAVKSTNAATRAALNDKAADVANLTARNLTEQGRSVQAASILGRLTPEGQLRFAAKEIQKYNEMVDTARGGLFGLKKKIPELTGKQADEILTEMKAINTMAEGEAKAIRFQQLQDRISALVPSSLYQKVVAVWKAGLLTGLKTSGLNIFSNISHMGSEILKDIPAVAVDKVASLFTKERTLAFATRGKPGALKEGFTKGIRYLKTGYSERNIGTKLDYNKVNFGNSPVARGIQKYEETIFQLMGAEDQPFYYGAKARSLYNQAKAQAVNKGLKGAEAQTFIDDLVKNPTDKMFAYATGDAEMAVFQNETVLGKIARQIQKAPGGEIALPFGRTPSAVATQIINYSPIGIVKTIFENIGKGRFDQRLFAQGIGRGITGTAVMATGAAVFSKGMIALDRPTSEKEIKLWELEGRKANSIKIDGKWRSVQVLGPAGNVLLLGAHFQNALDNSGSPIEAISTMAFGSVKSFTEQTFLTGINQIIDALKDPERSAPGFAGSLLSSTVPTMLADIARATDVSERRTESILQRFEARVPGLREMLEPQVSVLGKEKESIGNFLEIMADPTRPSPSQDSPVVAEFRRLWNNGFKVSPTLLGDKAGFQGLTPEQNTQLWKQAGQITESKLTGLFLKDAYWKLPDEEKAKVIDDITSKSKLFARVEVVLQLTDGLNGQELLTKLSELKKGGLMTKEVFNEFQRLR